MAKWLKVLLLVVAALVAIVVFVLYHRFDSPEFGQRISSALKESAGIDLQADEFALQIAHGFVLKRVRIATAAPGGRIELSADEVLFQHQLWPLLRGDVVIERVRFDRPSLTVTSAGSGEPTPAAPAPASPSAPAAPSGDGSAAPPPASGGTDKRTIRLSVHEVAITDATIELRTEGKAKPDATISGASLTLHDIAIDPAAQPKVLGLAGEGQVSFAAYTTPDMSLTDGKGAASIARGHLSIRDLGVASKLGAAAIDSIDVDATSRPFTYKMAAHTDAIDLNLAAGVNGKSLGPARARVTASGKGSDSAALVANGELTLTPGTLPNLKALQLLDRILKTSLVGTAYNASDFTVTLAKNVLQIKPFQFTSGRLRLGVGGTIDLAGPLDMQLSVSTPRSEIATDRELSAEVLDALTDSSGWLTFPVNLSGA